MNEDREREKGSLSQQQSGATIVEPKCPAAKQGRKYLVELLMTRKLTQIAAQKQSSGVLKHF